tara:strand:+ start:342 stop:1295 length:954 start_codon:yes stop_codon:yes gene_type:complete
MAFQNNSGDIILDVVLTDEGRRRLALGGSNFQVSKFALGDDEINYELFDTAATTALQDLSILQTPILEAFTNNTSMMKSKLLNLPFEDLLYLPILKLNTIDQSSRMTAQGNFVVCVNSTTWSRTDSNEKSIGHGSGDTPLDGMIYGLDTNGIGAHIVVDSGLDTDNLNDSDTSLVETSFIIEMDNRLGSIVSTDGKNEPGAAKIDDDHIAMYVLDLNDAAFAANENQASTKFITNVDQENFSDLTTPLNGPIGARLSFKIRSSLDLRTSNFLFDRIGTVDTTTYAHNNVKIIDSIVRVSGITTGYSVDIPVRFAKSV